jgi:hypothetical protein
MPSFKNDATNQSNIFNDNNQKSKFFQIKKQEKSLDAMERIKSKIELFNDNELSQLLLDILKTYGQLICPENTIDISSQIAFKNFEKQVTQNQNGIFLNLTNCSEELWNSCVYCVEQIEKQNNNLDMLDKERQCEMDKIRNSQLNNE